MHHSGFIFISVIAFALCENAVGIDFGNGNLPVATELPTPQNGTVEIQTTPNDERKLLEKGGDSIPKDSNIVELKQTPTKTDTDLNPGGSQDKSSPNPFPKRKTSDASNKNEVEALNKNKLKLKLTKLKEDLRKKAETAKNKWETFAKNLEKIGEKITNKTRIKKHIPFARNSREEKDYTKRMQILEWFYNGRPLLANETRLWANVKSENKFKADKDIKDKTDSQTEKYQFKSDKDHREAEFQTIEVESKAKEKQTSTTKRRADMAKVADAGSVKEESTTATPVGAQNNSEDSDSVTRNGLHMESDKSREKVMKPKMSAKIESETDMTSEESIENVTVLDRAADTKNEKVRTVQRFAPMKDGPSSSESTSVS